MKSGRVLLVVAVVLALVATSCSSKPANTATPIHHLVVIFQENASFDHYFGTYPRAANIDGQPFTAVPGTPTFDGLTSELLTNNPNEGAPMRLGGPAQQVTCSQDHEYTANKRLSTAAPWINSSRTPRSPIASRRCSRSRAW
jgi:phospholipase C